MIEDYRIENISEIFKHQVYKGYFDSGCDPNKGLTLVDIFLKKYPTYPEALIFKARMLIVNDDYNNALQYIDSAKKVDIWRVCYLFDEAEIFYKINKREEAIVCIVEALEHLLNEAMDGVVNFLLSIDEINESKRTKLKNDIFFEMKKFISDKSYKINIDFFQELSENI